MSDWIVMRFLDMGQRYRLFSFTVIPNTNDSVCATSTDDVCEFVVEGQVCDGRRRVKRYFWSVGVVDVPNVGVSLHFIGGLLESRDGIGDGQFGGSFCVP